MPEIGIKGAEEPLIIPPVLDGMFNLTVTYRHDSDVTRHCNDLESVLRNSRFDPHTGELIKSDKQFFEDLMDEKVPYGSPYNTAWFVSDCNHTSGALKRWEYGQSLVKGKKVQILKNNFNRILRVKNNSLTPRRTSAN